MSTEPNSVESNSGIVIDSSEPITKEEREYLKTREIKPIRGRVPEKAAKAEPEPKEAKGKVEIESVDQGGKTHGTDGRFKGKEAKEQEPKDDAEKVEAKAEEKEPDAKEKDSEAERVRKQDAASRIQDLATKKNKAEERAAGLERQLKEAEEKLKAAKPAEPKPAEPEPKKDTRPNIKDYDDYEKYAEDLATHLERKAEEVAERKVKQRDEEREQQQRAEQRSKELQESITAGDAAIKKAGGEKFLDKVAPTMSRVLPSFEAERLGLEIKPIHALGDFVLHSGAKVTDVMLYIHENDPEIVDRFVSIGELPVSRQPLAVERELGMLYGALKALHKVKASVTTDNPEPDVQSFKPRAEPPPPSVQGSPHIAEPDLSKVDDFGEYMRLKGKRPKSLS